MPTTTVVSQELITEQPTLIAGGNGQGNLPNQINTPVGMAMLPDGLAVASSDGHAVLRFQPTSSSSPYLATSAPVAGIVGSEGTALDHLARPSFIAANANGDLYIADSNNHRVVLWPRGAMSGTVAAQIPGRPVGVAITDTGVLFVTDIANHTLLRITSPTDPGTVIAGNRGAGKQLNQLSNPRNVRLQAGYCHLQQQLVKTMLLAA